MSTLRSGIEELRSEDVGSSPDAAIEEDLAELFAVGDALEAEVLRRLAVIDQRRSFERDGFLSTVSWLVARFRLSRAKAAELVRVARSTQAMPTVQAAHAAGELTGSAVRVLSGAQQAHPEAFAASERILVDAAASLPVPQLRSAVEHWRELADAEDEAGANERVHQTRAISASTTTLGTVRVDGDLDPENGECFMTALQAKVDADLRSGPADDPRTPAQRRADALGAICREWLGRNDRPGIGAERPHLSVIVDLEVLRGRGPGRCELEHTGAVAAELARRLACDASVTRVVLGARSEPLDLGRRTQVVPAPLRRAVVIRDRGCRFPGCDRPNAWCDAHHVRHWADGGATALANLVLLCRPHHRLVHEGGFGLRMVDGTPSFTRPDGSPLEDRAPP